MIRSHTREPQTAAQAGHAYDNHGGMFVRSQLQLASFVPGAKGRVLNQVQAVEIFGEAAVERVRNEGSFPLAADRDEPASTIRARCEDLQISVQQLAKHAQVMIADVEKAQTAGCVVQIHVLERIAQALALDERVVGHEKGARGDRPLGVRLRETLQQSDSAKLTENDVLQLTEAAWVISRQVALDETMNGPRLVSSIEPSGDYRYRAFDRGEELAARTRRLLKLDGEAPILSLKSLAEETLRIPVIQQRLGEQFAGATVANGPARGVVINERGMNENVSVRRMTLAHELGHLLWDPDGNLNRLKVHSYDEVEGSIRAKDPVEIRANAFAVNFLAPRGAITHVMAVATSPAEGVRQVMDRYGISATAAKHHVRNITGISVDAPAYLLGRATDDWIGRENLGIDLFRPETTPISRRGKFAWHVVAAEKKGLVSTDTCAGYLRCTEDAFIENRDYIRDLLGAD